MKYRPILFSGPMVRALLNGRKTQTRRVVKARPDKNMGSRCVLQPHELAGEVNRGDYQNCPYGQPGDRLWVREAHAFSVCDPEGYDWHDDPENWDVIYRADEHQPAGGWRDSEGNAIPPPWRPSIHMPRWASRITLEVTGVRVERVQDISEADAMAEGCGMLKPYSDHWQHRDVAKEEYRCLWETLHPRMGETWGHNPWVWVVEFRRVEGDAT